MNKIILVGSIAMVMMAQPQKKMPASPGMDATVSIGDHTIAVKYSAPSMKGRKIFGGLVPYGQVWRAGANSATALHTDGDLMIGTLMVPKGDYTLYVLPTADSWQLIVNKQTGQWGTEYSEGQDLGRVKMTVTKAAAPVELFKISLLPVGGKKVTLQMEWEDSVATVPVMVH